MTELGLPKRRFALLRRGLRRYMPDFYGIPLPYMAVSLMREVPA
jgi:hypothetical protein